MKKLATRQKMVLGDFLSNFALVWISFGFVGPIFSKVEDVSRFFINIFVSAAIAVISLAISLIIVQ